MFILRVLKLFKHIATSYFILTRDPQYLRKKFIFKLILLINFYLPSFVTFKISKHQHKFHYILFHFLQIVLY